MCIKGDVDKTQLIMEYADGSEAVVMERRKVQGPSGYRAAGYGVFFDREDEDADYRSVYDSLRNGPIVRSGRVQQKPGVGEYSSWNYELNIDFSAAEYERQDSPVVIELDLQDLIDQAGGGILDPN